MFPRLHKVSEVVRIAGACYHEQNMRSFDERTEFLRHCACRVRPLVRWYKLCLALLILPSIGLAQLSHIETAARLLSQGQMDEAETEARQALGNPTTRALALAMLGTIRLEQGKYRESTEFLTRALVLNPHLVGARTSLGNAYLLQGKSDLARNSFQDAVKLDPANFNARFGLAKVEASLHNYRRSLDVAGPIAAQLRESDDGILLLATDYGSLGRKEELRDLVRARQQLPTPSDESSLEFGNVLAMFGMTLEANQVFEAEEAKITAHPSPALAFKLGKSYLSRGVLDRAEQNLQRSLDLNPACAACDQGLAEIAERQGNTEKALAYLVAAKKLDPEDPEILFEFGKVCLQRNLPQDALPALAKAVALKPDWDPYVYVLASANVAQGNLSNARSLFARMLERHPHDAVLKYSIGAVDYLQGKYAEAESSLKQSLQAQPDQVAASYYLGLTYDALGQDERAVAMFRELLRSHPEHAPSCVKLGSILLRQHNYDEAQQDLERAILLDPVSVQAHYQLGLLYRRLGRSAESETQFAESRRLEAERSSETDLKLRLLLPD
jgi:tetratricopeptide (TPR) repeat protein